jgi:hypothetical protein
MLAAKPQPWMWAVQALPMRLVGPRASEARNDVGGTDMIELMVIFLVVGGLWLVGSLIGLVFKVTFGLIGGVFSLLAGALGMVIGGVVLLLVLPLIALSLLPVLLPALLLFGLIWTIVHLARKPTVTPVAR